MGMIRNFPTNVSEATLRAMANQQKTKAAGPQAKTKKIMLGKKRKRK